MSKLSYTCPVCQKKTYELSHYDLGEKRFLTLECSHVVVESKIKVSTLNEITLHDKRSLYPFQVQGVRFAENSNFKCLIADEMGLGKTVQAVASAFLHFEELKPFLIVVKASLTYQWLKEFVSGTGNPKVQILDSKTPVIPNFDAYICSFDSLPPRKKRGQKPKTAAELFENDEYEKTGGLIDKVAPLGIKTLIIDEAQMIKNHSSSRTNALREIARSESVKHIIALSGTPIKNNATEYFPILNLLRPEVFYNRDRFISQWVEQYWTGTNYRAGGISKRLLEQWEALTKDFIIRRSRDEVLPDLPKIQRDYKFYPMSQEVKQAYNKKVKALSDFMDENEDQLSSFKTQAELIGHLQILRHITGLAKIEPVVDYVNEFLEGDSEEKITIFHHHKDVGEILFRKLSELFPELVLRMTAEDNSEVRMKKIEEFKTSKRILIAPTLACGEGINLQFCSHAILMEREWNPANEEQAEGRFSRIGSVSSSVLINYPTATGTIDEFFAELVEQKRAAVTQTLDGVEADWNESDIMRELARVVVKKWRM